MTDHPHYQLIEKLYQSFQNGDAAGMAACYHPEATFEDPAFGKLQGREVGEMWAMLLERGGNDLEITYSDIRAGDEHGAAYWEAKYPFSRTGRRVHNKIHSHFTFREGKIIEQKDVFSLWRWASMALGLPGKLMGFMPFFRKKVQGQSRGYLRRYMGRES